MLVKFENCGISNLVYIPENIVWQLEVNTVSPNGCSFVSLNLTVGDKKYCIDDEDSYCMGRPALPESEIEDLFNDIVDRVYFLISADNSNNKLDFDKIILELVEQRKQQWVEKEYIIIDENGNW